MLPAQCTVAMEAGIVEVSRRFKMRSETLTIGFFCALLHHLFIAKNCRVRTTFINTRLKVSANLKGCSDMKQ